jgi:cold shock CspA family protein
MDTRTHGAVATLQLDRGFAFIEADGTRARYFAHCSGFRRGISAFADLAIGRRVTFVATEAERGLRAEDVEVEGHE